MSKKIFIAANSCWNILNFRESLIRKLLSQNYRIFILAPRDSYSDELINIGCELLNVRLAGRSIAFINNILTIFDYLYYSLKHKPKYILTFTIKPNLYFSFLSIFFNYKVIVNITGLGFNLSKPRPLNFFIIVLYKLFIKNAFFIFFQNKDDKNFFLKHINPFKKSSFRVLPGSGVNLSKFSFSPFKPKKEFRIMMISRLLITKGVLNYLEAANYLKSKYRNINFTLVGENIDIPIDLKTLPYVKYFNHTDDVKSFLRRCDILVHPSYYGEGVPRILLEALASGRPIITTNSVGCKEVVRDGENGFVVEPNNTKDLIEKIEAMMLLPRKKISQMCLKSRLFAEKRFDERRVINAYLSIVK